ncbi:MAG: Zn-ribbon domain-containing OB-fold protein [Candidatus Helarchaeota archaeon]
MQKIQENIPTKFEFFIETDDGIRLVGAKCKKCSKIMFPWQEYCSNCQSTDLERIIFSKTGKLLTYTVSYIRPLVGRIKPPYAYGVVELPEGLNIFTILESKEPFDDLVIDSEVEVVLDEKENYFKFKSVKEVS